MQKSTLVAVFKSLGKEDLQALRKMVNSPYFNKRADVILLYDYLAKAIRGREALLNRESIYAAVYPNSPFDIVKLRHVMSFLMSLTKRYFTEREMEANSTQMKLYLCRALRKRGLDNLFQKELKSLHQEQQKQSIRNTRYHYYNYLLHSEQYEYASEQSRLGDMPLQELSDELTIFCLADTLRYGCTVLSHKSMQHKPYEIRLLADVLRHIETYDYSDIPAVAVYYRGYRALSDPANVEDFKILKDLMEQHWASFPQEEIRGIYLLAINFCIRKLNSGYQEYIREAFELYRAGLTNQAFLEKGYVSGFNFKNALRLGVALEEYDWARDFLDSYQQLLHPRERENAYRYNLAFFHFQRREYDRALELLSKVDFKDVLNNLDARRMLLRIYYELAEYDALESLLDSFHTYIHRQKDIGYHRDNYLALIRIVRKLLRSNLEDRSTRLRIRKLVENTKPLAEKNWLLEQLDT